MGWRNLHFNRISQHKWFLNIVWGEAWLGVEWPKKKETKNFWWHEDLLFLHMSIGAVQKSHVQLFKWKQMQNPQMKPNPSGTAPAGEEGALATLATCSLLSPSIFYGPSGQCSVLTPPLFRASGPFWRPGALCRVKGISPGVLRALTLVSLPTLKPDLRKFIYPSWASVHPLQKKRGFGLDLFFGKCYLSQTVPVTFATWILFSAVFIDSLFILITEEIYSLCVT
jgi:hypothetical protein